MGIDASIYQNIKPVQVDLPNPLAAAEQGMKLSQLGMQQQQMQYQLRTQQAMRQAYANNTDPQTGQLNQQGFLSEVGKADPMTAMSLSKQLTEQNKAAADAKASQFDAAKKNVEAYGPGWENINGAAPDQRPVAYQAQKQQWAIQGLDVSKLPDQFDPTIFNTAYNNYTKTKNWVDNQKTVADTQNTQANTNKTVATTPWEIAKIQSEIGKNKSDQLKTGAEELGKFNDSINDPSVRKTLGGLTDIVNRSSRIQNLLNAGAQPNETPEQRVTRLDKAMPMIGNEVGLATASMLQGGMPTEGLTKEISPDTIQGHLAELQTKFTASPTAANQGKLLDAYGDIANRLGSWAQKNRQDTVDRMRAGYPYANSQFPKEMDKITSPLSSQSNDSVKTSQAAGTANQTQAGPATIKMMSPSGKIKLVPLSQKGEAIAAGGKVVQ